MEERLWDNPIGVLVAIRDERAHDWTSLCKLCGCRPHGSFTDTAVLARHIRSLIRVGLLSFTGAKQHAEERLWIPEGDLTVTDLVQHLQLALSLSLKEASLLDSHFSMVVRPRFGRPSRKPNNPDLFVLMPFEQSMSPIYEDHIKSVARRLGLSINRADDFFTEQSIVDDIWEAINAARVILADCTGRNANVFYEIGIAHVLGKPVIPVTQAPEDIPFDIGHLRYIRYQYTPRGMTEFEADLNRAIGHILKESKDPVQPADPDDKQ